MPRKIRYTVRMSEAEHGMLKAVSEALDKDAGAAIRWLVKCANSALKAGVVDVSECSSIVRQSFVNCASIVRQLGELDPNSSQSQVTEIIGSESGTKVALKDPEEDNTKKKTKAKETQLAPLPISEEIVTYLNKTAGTNVKPKGKGVRRLIQVLLNDGYEVADFKAVIRKKSDEWLGTQMQTNLNQKCLFRPSNFESYLGALETVRPTKPAQTTLLTDAEKRKALMVGCDNEFDEDDE